MWKRFHEPAEKARMRHSGRPRLWDEERKNAIGKGTSLERPIRQDEGRGPQWEKLAPAGIGQVPGRCYGQTFAHAHSTRDIPQSDLILSSCLE